ncbi:MAG: hypothetical protein U1E22_07975 [Coriobacteriia bacterium]|nr:hypothetical protein [Coriobacteriia bacterium]
MGYVRRVLVLFCVTVTLAGLISGCQVSSHDEERAAFDEAIHDVEHQFAAFYLLGSDAASADVQSFVEELSFEWKSVERAAEGLDGIDIADAAAAHQDLIDAVEALPEDAEAGEPMRIAMPLFETFKTEVEQVHESGGFHD